MRWLRRLAIDISPLRASREFRLLWSGSVVSAMGSQFARVGLYVQVYALTGSPAAVGLLGLSGLAGSLAGVFVGASFIDRHDRRITLLWTQLAAIGGCGDPRRRRGRRVIRRCGSCTPRTRRRGSWRRSTDRRGRHRSRGCSPTSRSRPPSRSTRPGWQVASIVGPALAGVLIAASGTGGRLRRRRSDVHHRVRRAAPALRPLPPGQGDRSNGACRAVAEGLRYPPRPPAAAVDVRDRPRRDDLREPAGVDAR